MAGIEYLKIQVPAGFDPARHGEKMLEKVVEKQGTNGWVIDDFFPDTNTLTVKRQSRTTEVTGDEGAKSKTVRLKAGTKPSDGDRIAVEMADKYAGYFMTNFDPFLGRAVLSTMTDNEVRCRGAVANAIGCKTWEVRVKETPDGGFTLNLPAKYTPSKHFDKLEEVATSIVGSEGWYVAVDAKELTARMIPSEPPTFPSVLKVDLARLGKGDVDVVPMGRRLPPPGEDEGEEVLLDWTASAHLLLGGVPQSGKSVLLNCIVSDALANGSELVIVDDVSKMVDFLWCKQWVRDGGWGCDSLEAAVGALGLVYEEGQRRAPILAQYGVTTWLDLPRGKRFTPITVIVDELSALAVMDPEPKMLPKDNPLRMEIAQKNLARAMLSSLINKIIAEQRFVGIRMVLSTQATNANTGVPPSLRSKIGHIILQGTKPSKSARGQIFTIDESQIPHVPENVASGGSAGRGTGVATLEGQPPFVYKSYFASVKDYAEALGKLGLRESNRPAPTSSEIDRIMPSLDDTDLDAQPVHDIERGPSGRPASELFAEIRGAEAKAGIAWDIGADGKPLRGFEKANAARHAVTQNPK